MIKWKHTKNAQFIQKKAEKEKNKNLEIKSYLLIRNLMLFQEDQ